MSNLFKGIRRNIERTNNSVSANNIERIQRKVMSHLYKDENGDAFFMVVRRVDVDDCGNAMLSYQTIGQSPVAYAFGELETEEKQLSVRKEKKDGVLLPAKEEKVGPNRKYRLFNNIILVSFKNAEGRYEDARLKGMEVEGVKYWATSGSASMGKKSKVFFTNEDANTQFTKMDALTGGLLSKALENMDEADYDQIANIAGRVSLAATTPSLWPKAGVTGNIFYFHGSIESQDEETKVNKIDNNFRDGFGVISDRIGSEMAEEYAGERVSCAQARRMSYQLRVRRAAGKGHFRAYALYQRLNEIKAMLEIDQDKCYCWIDSKKISLDNLSDKELLEIAAKVDIILDKDVAKWGQYIIDEERLTVEIGIVNMSNKASGKLGTQIIFKLRDDMDEAIEYVKAITERQLVEEEAAEGKITFEKDEIRLTNTAYYNCKNNNPERAQTDALLNNFKIKQLDTAMLSKVANLKLKINSNYLRLVPEDSLLNNRQEVLGSHVVNYTMPDGTVQQVKCLEVYSPAWEKEYYELAQEVAANTAMTNEEKEIVLTNARVCTAIKSPSQGDNEFEVFYLVLAKEIKERNATQEYYQFIVETPNNCIVIAQDNTVKRQLAGSDFDGDDVTIIYPEFTMTEDSKITTGLIYNDKLINDYTSLIVRKRVREGNIGYAALIEYNMDCPIRFEEETKVEEEPVADYMKNLDVSNLF